MIRVTAAQAAGFILRKNYLTMTKASDVIHLAEVLGGLPAPSSSTPFLSALARLDEFQPDPLLAALSQTHQLIRAELMRNVTYLIPTEQYPSLHAATRRQRNQTLNSEFRLWGIDNPEIEQLAVAILAVLAEQPLSIEEISQRLPRNLSRVLTQTSRGGRVSTTSNVALALRWLAARGDLYTALDPQDWRSDRLRYGRLNAGYPELDLSTVPDEADAQANLVRRYLTAFGPATEADISLWTGLGKSETARAVAALSSETVPTMVEGIPGMLLLLKPQADELRPAPSFTRPVVNILPAGDPFTSAHWASRNRYVSDQSLQRHIFTSSGAARPSIVVNGQIVGIWDWQIADEQDRITWQLLVEPDPAVEPLIEVELERVGRFIGSAVRFTKTA